MAGLHAPVDAESPGPLGAVRGSVGAVWGQGAGVRTKSVIGVPMTSPSSIWVMVKV